MNDLYQDAKGTWTRPITNSMRHQWAINHAECVGIPYSLFGGNVLNGRVTRNATALEEVAEMRRSNKGDCAMKPITNRLPVRNEVTEAEYHRQPTQGELQFGHGAIHYRTFDIADCTRKGTRVLKQWFIAPDDGLRYYR